MSTLSTVVRYESRLLRADGLARLTVVLFVALLAYAGWTGVQRAQAVRATNATFTADYAEDFDELYGDAVQADSTTRAEGLSPDSVNAYPQHPYALSKGLGRVVTLDPGPLAAFATGQSDLAPHTFRIVTSAVRPFGAEVAIESPFRLLAGSVDLAFVFLTLFPLLVLALYAGLTTTERESGLLRVLLAQPLRLSTLAAGKALVRGALLVACVVLGTGAVFVASGSDAVGRWLLWLLVALVYGGFWVALAALVDSRVRKPTAAAVVLAGCWLVLAVVVPSALSVAADVLYPAPSRMAYVAAQRAETSQAQRESEASLARYFGDHPELAADTAGSADDFYRLSVARDARVANALAPLDARFELQRERRHRLVNALGYFSPTVLAQRAFLDVAGTGEARHRAFAEQAQAFRAEWTDRYVPGYFTGRVMRASDYTSAPTFTFREAPAGHLWSRLFGPLAALALASALLAALAARGYARPGSAL